MNPLKDKQRLMLGVALLVAAFLIITSIYVYLEFLVKEEIVVEEKVEPEIDDRISPGLNQGLSLEINRIRHRGLLDKILKPGRSWKNKPMFYFITRIDGLEYISKDVVAPGGETETFFNTWDTMFQENKISHNAEEEQRTSEIILKIVERRKIGVFGLRSVDEERERISLIYDYKTGRWHGDDFFNDSDGYGHYVGDTFEVWFNIYQTDIDRDGIPYWTEVNVLHTDPEVDDSTLDPDGDGIPTVWEWKWGYDPFVYDNHSVLDPDKDGLENIEEYRMRKWFADPFRPDIYIESDGMERGGVFDPPHVFWEESQQIIIERFAQHGINVYIDNGWPGGPVNGGGEILRHYETISQESGMMLQFYRNHFSDDRKGVFRYLLIAHSAGFCHPSEFNRYDVMAVGTSHHRMIIGRGAFTQRTYRLMLATSIMHEIGHSLGIAPWNVGGCDNISFLESKEAEKEYLEKWGNYKSVMNYLYIYDKNLVDYSDGTHGKGDFDDWGFFNLAFFQEEAKVIEDPGFQPPGEEETRYTVSMFIRSTFYKYLNYS